MSTENLFEGLLNGLSSQMSKAPGEKREWWHTLRYPDTPNFSAEKLLNCARSALFGEALGGGPPVRDGTWHSSAKIPAKEVIAKVQRYVTNELDARLIYNIDESAFGGHLVSQLFFVFSGGAILVTVEPLEKTCLKITFIGTTEAHMQVGKDIVDTCLKEGSNV